MDAEPEEIIGVLCKSKAHAPLQLENHCSFAWPSDFICIINPSC